MARIIRSQFPVHNIRAVDGDTLQAWVEVSAEIRQLWRIRLRGIEGGELDEATGQAAKYRLQQEIYIRAGQPVEFVGNERELDQFGRHVGDLRFGNGELLTLTLLATGLFWRRERNGKQHPPGASGGQTV